MRTLFVDAEWNIPFYGGSQGLDLLSIGCRLEDSAAESSKGFFRLIRPEHPRLLNQQTVKLLKVGNNLLSQANTCEEVLCEFCDAFPRSDLLVIWSSVAFKMLEEKLTDCGLPLPTKRIIILQDFLVHTFKTYSKHTPSFKECLKQFEVPFRTDLLHNAKYDAIYLQDLFAAVSEQMHQSSKMKVPLYHTAYSRVLHREGCPFTSGRDLRLADWGDALRGKHLCAYCLGRSEFQLFKAPMHYRPKSRPKKITPPPPEPYRSRADIPKVISKAKRPVKKYVPLDEEEFTEYCAKRNIQCSFGVGIVYLRTPAAHWKIEHEGTDVHCILHENRRPHTDFVTRLRSANGSFHQQQVKVEDIYEAVRYIYGHDRQALKPRSRDKETPCLA